MKTFRISIMEEYQPQNASTYLKNWEKCSHEFATENGAKTKMYFNRDTCTHKFKIGDKVLISNNFNTMKNPKLVPNWKGLAEIID